MRDERKTSRLSIAFGFIGGLGIVIGTVAKLSGERGVTNLNEERGTVIVLIFSTLILFGSLTLWRRSNSKVVRLLGRIISITLGLIGAIGLIGIVIDFSGKTGITNSAELPAALLSLFLFSGAVMLLRRPNSKVVPLAVLRQVIDGEIQAPGNTSASNVNALGHTTPAEFEEWCAARLRERGWEARVTGQSGDQGVDIRASREGLVVVLQCKRHKQPVGNSAIQEVFAGKSLHRAHVAAVISTAGFTRAAKELVAATGVHLLIPDELPSFSPNNTNVSGTHYGN